MTDVRVFFILIWSSLESLGIAIVTYVLFRKTNGKIRKSISVLLSIICSIALTAFLFNSWLVLDQTGVEANRSKYPLNQAIQVTVEREKLNTRYDELSESEMQLFELSQYNEEIYVTRMGNNVIIVQIGDEQITLYEPKDGKTSNEWVLELNKGYFNPTERKSRMREVFVNPI